MIQPVNVFVLPVLKERDAKKLVVETGGPMLVV